MTVQPIDVPNLPLLLCGPILRRVSTTDVSVFVVLKEHRHVQLKLYGQANTFTTNDQFVDNPISTLTFAIQDVVRLGEHFFVGMATLTLPDDQPLNPGQHYWYNVFFHDTADGSGGAVSLAQTDFQLLTHANEHRIGFEYGYLPGFVVPPQDLLDLNIIQGSCRKPHGEGIDMLAAADNLLALNGAERGGADRPHLLIHGGDQIYADDVSPTLLRMIHEASNALLGWDETLAGTGPQADFDDVMAGALMALRNEITNEDGLTDPINDRIEQLADVVSEAIGSVQFSDDLLENRLVTEFLKWQLRDVESDAREWVTANPVVDPQKAESTLAALQSAIASWFETYEQLFDPLSTASGWGRIALAQNSADRSRLRDLRVHLAEADRSSDTGATLRTRVITALDVDVIGADLKEWLERLQARAAATSTDDSEVRAFLTAIRVEWFDDLPFPDDPNEPAVDRAAPKALDAFKYVPSRIAPPQRGLELKQHGKLTSDAMDAHLMFAGEFHLMYTMVWSDVLWPREDSGAPESFVFPEYYEAVPNYGLATPLQPRVLKEQTRNLTEFASGLRAARRVLANVPSLMMFDDHEVTDDWNLNEDWVLDVNKKPAGAQLLRNAMVAYAIFQDWGNQPEDYLDIAGPNDVRADVNPLGRQLLDAVTYTPLPGTGSDASGGADGGADGTDDDGDATPSRPPPPLYQPGDASIDAVDAILGTGESSVNGRLTGLTLAAVVAPLSGADTVYKTIDATGRKRWDWHYDITPEPEEPVPDSTDPEPTERPVRIISLDTRTHRAFPDEAWAAKVGYPLGMPQETGGKIAAASLINSKEIGIQLTQRFVTDGLHLVISPAPVFGLPLLEDFVQRLIVLNSGPEAADFESWQANAHGFNEFMTALRPRDCVLLSGDVHYAYSNTISFPPPDLDAGPNLPSNLLMQLCSSSMKNETALTQILGAVGHRSRATAFIGPLLGEVGEQFGTALRHLSDDVSYLIDNPGKAVTAFGEWWNETAPLLTVWKPDTWATWYLKLKDSMLYSLSLTSPAGLVSVAPSAFAFLGDLIAAEDGVADRGEFRIDFLSDVRTEAERRARISTFNSIGDGQIDTEVEGVADRIAEMPDVVGYNNIGQLRFSGPGSAEKDIKHELFWHPHGTNNKPLRPSGPIAPPLLASTVHGDRPALAALPGRIAQVARDQYEIWGRGTISESSPHGLSLLDDRREMMTAYDDRLSVALPNRLKFSQLDFVKDEPHAWSALFVSHVMHLAQAGDLWFCSPRHIDYVRAAHANSGTDNPFRLHFRSDTPVRVGDVVGGKDMSEEQATAPLDGTHVGTHFDIVVAVHEADGHRNQKHLHMIGGNVSNTVKSQVLSLDGDGKLLSPINYLIRAEVS